MLDGVTDMVLAQVKSRGRVKRCAVRRPMLRVLAQPLFQQGQVDAARGKYLTSPIAQLLPLPADLARAEEQACAALFRDPPDWITVEALKDLWSVHFPVDLPDIPSKAMAARARAARFENAAHGGLRIRRRARDLPSGSPKP